MPIFKVRRGHDPQRIAMKATDWDDFCRKAKSLLKIPEDENIKITLEEDGTLFLDWETLREYANNCIIILQENDRPIIPKAAAAGSETTLKKDDVLKKLGEIRSRRLNASSNPEPQSKKKVKPTLKLTCGIKTYQNGIYKSIKAKTGIRMTLERGLKYEEVKDQLKEEFAIIDEDSWLLGHDNKVVNENGFTVGKYYEDWKGIGYCRLYLAVKSRAFNPVDCDDNSTDLEREEAEVSFSNETEITDVNVKRCKERSSLGEIPAKEEIPTTGSSGERQLDLNQLPGSETKKLKSESSNKSSLREIAAKEEIPTTGSSGEKPGTETKVESATNSAFHYNFDADTLNGYFVDFIEEENITAIRFENTDTSADSLKGVDTKLFTPVHLRNQATTFYKDYQENKGVKLSTVISRYGQFLLIPNKDFDAYLAMAYSLPIREMFTVNPATLKFASDFSHYHISALSKNVWIFPYEAVDHFREWFDAMKAKVKASM